MKQGYKRLVTLLTLLLCACLCLASVSLAETDEFGNTIIHNPDGSITVITDDENPNAGKIVLPTGDESFHEPITGEEWDAQMAGAAALNGTDTPTWYTDRATGAKTQVRVKYMGLARSMVVLDGKEQLVNTVDLSWETTAPEGKVLAVIAPKSNGYVSLRKKSSSKSLKLEKCRIDSVVRVISTGKNWTMIDYNGIRGYVMTSSLEFHANDRTEYLSGVISVKGRTKGTDTVTVRSRAKNLYRLEAFKVGTPLTVFSIEDQWANVEVGGFHCRIDAKYVTLDENLTASN